MLVLTNGGVAPEAFGWAAHVESTADVFREIGKRERWLTRTEQTPWAALLVSEQTRQFYAFEDIAGGSTLIDLFAQGLGRRSTPAEQGWPMIFLNSDAASYISGENLNTDGGTVSAITTGRLVLEFNLEALEQQQQQ